MPDETSEVDICVPESCEHCSTVLGASPVSSSVLQLPVSVSDEEVGPSLSQENVSRPTAVVLRRSERIRKRIDRLNLYLLLLLTLIVVVTCHP